MMQLDDDPRWLGWVLLFCAVACPLLAAGAVYAVRVW